MAKKLLSPEDAWAWLRRRYLSQHRAWLNGEGTWSLSVLLGEPTEKTVAEDAGLVPVTVDAIGYSDAWEAIVAHSALAVEYQGPARPGA